LTTYGGGRKLLGHNDSTTGVARNFDWEGGAQIGKKFYDVILVT